CQKYTNSPLTF
nr:immunoglobulin light chain junction region [Macaca mulatta]